MKKAVKLSQVMSDKYLYTSTADKSQCPTTVVLC